MISCISDIRHLLFSFQIPWLLLFYDWSGDNLHQGSYIIYWVRFIWPWLVLCLCIEKKMHISCIRWHGTKDFCCMTWFNTSYWWLVSPLLMYVRYHSLALNHQYWIQAAAWQFIMGECWQKMNKTPNIDGLVLDCSISITNVLEILQSCIEPSICCP